MRATLELLLGTLLLAGCIPQDQVSALSSQALSKQATQSDGGAFHLTTRTEAFTLVKDDNTLKKQRSIRSWFRGRRKKSLNKPSTKYEFLYNYNVFETNSAAPSQKDAKLRCVLMIPPVGVGIGRWFYDRLLKCLVVDSFVHEGRNLTDVHSILAPDLLASGSAAQPLIMDAEGRSKNATTLPLMQVKDWSRQLMALMDSYEHMMLGRQPSR
jgi:hypothetical protein